MIIKKFRNFFLCLLILVLRVTGFGQQYNFKNYSIEEGLAQSQVHSIFQDSYGYLWIGTLGGGVSRFNGRTFANFTTKEGLSDNHVLTIFEDSDHNIWFGTQQGVSRYDGQKFHPLNINRDLGNSVVRAILEDHAGNLWFGSEVGLWKYDRKTFSINHFTRDNGLPGDLIMTMIKDSKDRLWVGTQGHGIGRYDGTKFTNFSTADGLAGNSVYSILEDRYGNLWFGTYEGVSKYDGKTFHNYTVKQGLSHNFVRAIIEDREGNLWFGTNENGLCRFDGNRFTGMTEKNGLSSNVVWSLLEDREGNIWIGTYRGGLDKYSGDMFTYFSSNQGLGNDMIRWILLDRAGNSWFATYRGGVTRFDGKSMTTFTTKDGLIDNFVLTIFEDQKGNLWFGTYRGVSKYDGKTFTNFTQEDGLPDPIVRSIVEDRTGNTWFGTNLGGVCRYDGKTMSNFTTNDGLNSDQINTLMLDRQGTLWIGTENGLCHYDGKTFTDISEKCGLKPKNIYCIIEDKKGSLWIAAYGDGIIKFTPPACSFEVFSSKDGLANDNVVSMIFDDRGNLWIGTEKGICRLNIEGYERTGQKIFKYYGKEEGFFGTECIHNSISKDQEGNIWFGTLRGAIKYNPHQGKKNLVEPMTHITGLRFLFGENNWRDYAGGISRHGLPLGLRLPYNKNHLQLDFIGLSFTVPGKVKYRYKLAGFENSWVQVPVSESSYAIYSNLPPGKYTFEVKACNNDGIWNKTPASFDFVIIPPFWQTWWFYVSCAGVLVLGICLLVQIRIRHLQRQQEVLKEKVEIATRDLKIEKEKVEQINLELEYRVRERTAELVNANQSLHLEIAERKSVEEALRVSEEKFRHVVENANDAIFILQDDVVKFPNPKTIEMLGYSKEELEKIPFSKFIHPGDNTKDIGEQIKRLEGDELPGTYSFRVMHRDNKVSWVDLNSVPIQWEGRPAALNFFRDVTDKKRLEEQLLQAQKMEAIGTMAGGIAHDFNNLLMGILGNASLVLSEISANHPYHTEIKNIEQYAQNGAHLTRQLLGFARGGKYEVIPTDLNRLIKKTTEMFSHTRKEIRIYEKYEANTRTVNVDQGQIEQVLMNIYVNAWQAMPGGGEIYVQTVNITFDENEAQSYGLKPGNYVKVSITDTGIGMDETTRQRIFDPFFTTKELGRGTGLGLAAVYGIIAHHEGSIKVYSEKGKGTTFIIYLPACEKEVPKEKKLPGKFFMGTETVLLVDDESMVSDVDKRLLEKLGYTVLVAGSGKEAIAMYDKNKDWIELVILDMIMPGMGGGEVFDRLKTINPGIKVLLSSGYSIDGEAAQIMARGCKGFIQKPFDLKALSKKVRMILDNE
jgi:PAS domain S-box-containing protein